MKPAWDKLMKEYDGHKTALIADVDCTAEGKPLCDSNGVQGFPTIKYGDPSALEDYQGGRDLDAMKKFAAENLKPMCSPKNIDLCDDDKKKEIEKFQTMSSEDLEKQIKEKEDLLSEAEETFKAEVQKLQDKYQSLMKEKEEKMQEVKDAGLSLMKSVSAHAEKGGDKKQEL